MSSNDEQLTPVFIPTLSSLLIHAEDVKGEPLTYDEVIRIRDNAACIMMKAEDVERLNANRGYSDIDPENCWQDWQHLRREMGRKPDLDPGPRFRPINSRDSEYQKTLQDARDSLDRFRNMLPADGSPRAEAMVKTEIWDAGSRAFLWLCNVQKSGTGFLGEFYEVPPAFKMVRIGDQRHVDADSVMDWMVNDGGVLYGGFSIRYQRSTLPEAERDAYDRYIGVRQYAY